MKFFFGSKSIQLFSNLNAGNVGKKTELSVVGKAKIVALNEEKYSGRQILKN